MREQPSDLFSRALTEIKQHPDRVYSLDPFIPLLLSSNSEFLLSHVQAREEEKAHEERGYANIL